MLRAAGRLESREQFVEDTCDSAVWEKMIKPVPVGGVSSQSKGGYISLHEERVLWVEMVSRSRTSPTAKYDEHRGGSFSYSHCANPRDPAGTMGESPQPRSPLTPSRSGQIKLHL